MIFSKANAAEPDNYDDPGTEISQENIENVLEWKDDQIQLGLSFTDDDQFPPEEEIDADQEPMNMEEMLKRITADVSEIRKNTEIAMVIFQIMVAITIVVIFLWWFYKMFIF